MEKEKKIEEKIEKKNLKKKLKKKNNEQSLTIIFCTHYFHYPLLVLSVPTIL